MWKKNYKMILEIDLSFLFFHSLRSFGLNGSLLFARKRFLCLYSDKCGSYYCENITIEFGPSCAFLSFPPTSHTPQTLGLDLTLSDVEINLGIQY